MYTTIHTYKHTYSHTYIQTYIQPYMHTYSHTCIQTYIQPYIYTTYIHIKSETSYNVEWEPRKKDNFTPSLSQEEGGTASSEEIKALEERIVHLQTQLGQVDTMAFPPKPWVIPQSCTCTHAHTGWKTQYLKLEGWTHTHCSKLVFASLSLLLSLLSFFPFLVPPSPHYLFLS